ncbi:MAG: hypothetical protein IKI21_03305 [Oscillospiraceae bacterium]|nr:hypothetical protein [Oscillospiraceae bacterium]
MRRPLAALAAAAALLAGMAALPAHAYTAEDIAEKMREVGTPESQVQAAYNDMLSGGYDESWYDIAYEELEQDAERFKQRLRDYYGIPAPETPDVTPDTPDVPAEDDALYAPDGAVVARVSDAEFIDMSYEAKQAYIDGLDDASKQRFLASLSDKARNSMIKSLPAADQAAFADILIDAADAVGMQMTVDQIGGGTVDYTVRDQEGVVIDRASVGIAIDETGISHTLPYAGAAAAVLASLTGLALVYRAQRRGCE